MSLPPRIVKRKITLLESELRMLQTYKTDASLLFDEYSKEYARDMSAVESRLQNHSLINDQVNNKDTFSDDTTDTVSLDPNSKNQEWKKTEAGWERVGSKDDAHSEQPTQEKIAAPEWAKKLYRKIALIAHPDRSSDDFNRSRLKKIFLESSDAMSEGEFSKLLGLALELGIPSNTTDAASIPILQNRVSDVKSEISTIEKSLEWLWGESIGAPSIRANIAQLFFSNKGIIVKIEELVSIIEQLEKDNEEKGLQK